MVLHYPSGLFSSGLELHIKHLSPNLSIHSFPNVDVHEMSRQTVTVLTTLGKHMQVA